MKHTKFKYHTFNKIRNYVNKSTLEYYNYAYFLAWYYFQFKEYQEV